MPTDEISSPSTAKSSAFQVGQKLAGIYILREQVSDRAEGEIWLAHDEVLGKDVSLHFIPTVLRGDNRAMGEIRQEIKRNRQLIHPGILRVYDLVEEPEWTAISMDWFEGESLATVLQKRPGGFFDPADLKPWLQQVCHTLDDIHKIQIVHRDVAPHNIFVDSRGKVLLAKFGISRVIEDAVARVKKGSGPDPRLASLSPQSLDGENPSKADDIYSIGATIYELLTGELPFVGENLVAQIRKNPPQPMTERRASQGKRGGAIPPAWEKWVAAALAKPTTDRPTSAGDLGAKLGLSGKLPLEPVAPVPVSAPIIAPAAVAVVAVAPVAAETPKEIPAPAPPVEPPATEPIVSAEAAPAPEAAATPAPAATLETPPADTPSTSTAQGPESASESKVELPARGSGIKLPPSRFAGIAAAAAERKFAGKVEEKPSEPVGEKVAGKAVEKPAEKVVAKPAEQPVEKAAAKPLALEDDDRADSKDAHGSEGHQDHPPAAKSSKLIFAALIVFVGVLAYVLRPSKDEPKPALGTPVNSAEVTPTPKQVAQATPRTELATPGKEVGLIGERTITGPTPAPSTPLLKATPVVSPGNPGNDPTMLSGGDPDAVYASALKQEQQAKSELSAVQSAVEKKGKEILPLVKTSEPLLALRTKRADEVKSAEEAAEAARMAAEAKAMAVEEARKKQADWEATNAPKLAAYDKASADFKALQAKLTETKQQADDAGKRVAAADKARQERAAARAKEKEEAEALAMRTKENEAAVKLAAEKADADRIKLERKKQLDAEMAALQRQMKILQFRSEHPDDPLPDELKAPAIPVSSTPVPKPGSTPTATPGPVSSTPLVRIPPPPPSPKPNLPQTDLLNTVTPAVPLNPPTPAPPVATPTVVAFAPTPRIILSTPPATPGPPAPATPPVVRATPIIDGFNPQSTPAPLLEATGGESTLGLKFAPVGEVSFCIWPTRLQDFEIFAKETAYRGTQWRNPGFRQLPTHPVVNVSWTDAIAFCKWLTERDRKKGFLTKEQIYRLPTDLEWSKAIGLPEEIGKTPEARDMGVPDVFPWGLAWPPPPNIGNYTGEETGSDVAIRGYDDGFAWTSPVGTFPPNKYGLYDVGGNVWQWCMDNWSPESKAKVLRGASWYNGALKLSLLSSCRVSANPESSTDNYGFRVVRASATQKLR